jgi:hypothetical protein
VRSSTFAPTSPSSQLRKPPDLGLLLLVHLQHLLGQERQQVVDNVGLLLLRNEVALGVFRQKGIDAGQDFLELEGLTPTLTSLNRQDMNPNAVNQTKCDTKWNISRAI